MKFSGKVIKYGDNVDTDVIIPARYLNTIDKKELASHCMEDLDKTFIGRVKEGDIMVAGNNFGCGSSREHAPIAIKESGISLVIAKSFARIHVANLINFGIVPLTFENPDDYDKLSEGDELVICDFSSAVASDERVVLTDMTTGAKIPLCLSLSPRQREILSAGGLVNFTKQTSK